MLGTPHYMSPEQVRATKDVDHRTDIWSLGVVMYFLTTGKLPFAHASPTAVIAAIPFEEPKPPSWFTPDMPPAMEELILRCLRKDASERFANAAELHAALKPFAPKGEVRVEGARAIQSLPTVPLPKGEMAKTANPDPSAEAVTAQAVTVQAAKPRGTSRNAALIGTIAGDLSTVGAQRFSLRAPKVPRDLLDDVASVPWWRSPRLWATSIALVLAVWFWWSPATDSRAALPKPSVAPVPHAEVVQAAPAAKPAVDPTRSAPTVPAPSTPAPSVTPSTPLVRVPSRTRASLPNPALPRPAAPSAAGPAETPPANNPSHL
jgi:eukaryotic-like serine/threonine-protein kinase